MYMYTMYNVCRPVQAYTLKFNTCKLMYIHVRLQCTYALESIPTGACVAVGRLAVMVVNFQFAYNCTGTCSFVDVQKICLMCML